MLTRQSTLQFVLISCLAITFTPLARTANHFDDKDNAAYWYDQVLRLNAAMSREDSELILAIEWGHAPTNSQRAALARARPMLEALRHGAQQEYSDWYLDFSEGPGLLLPHLGALRHASKIATADIIVNMNDGHSAVAIDRLNSLTRLAGHLADDRVVISSLVGNAIYVLADKQIQMVLDRGDLAPSQSAQLLRATSWLDPNDPFGTIDSIAMEQVLFGEWLERTNEEEGGRQKIIDTFLEVDSADTIADMLRNLDDAGFAAGMDDYYETMDRYVEAFNHEDPEVARELIAAIEADIENGELGPLSTHFLPAFGRLYDIMLKTRADLAARNELLRGIAVGEVDPAELVNAAVWYMRGVENMKQLEQPWLEALALFAEGEVPDTPMLLALDDTLESARPALEQFAAGSKKRRCDFGYLQKGSEAFVPKYLIGMQSGLRLLELDTMRRLAHESADEIERNKAIVELSALFRITAHLSDDEMMLSTLIAHDAFAWSAATLRAEILGEARAFVRNEPEKGADAKKPSMPLNAKYYRLVSGSIRWISQSDPFGYLRSPMKTRTALAKRLPNLARAMTAGKSPYQLKDAEEYLKTSDGERLFLILAILDTVDSRGRPLGGGALSQVIVESFEQFHLPTVMADGIVRASVFMDFLQEKDRGDEPAFSSKIEDHTDYKERRRSARKDLRRLVRYLEKFDPTPKAVEKTNNGSSPTH